MLRNSIKLDPAQVLPSEDKKAEKCKRLWQRIGGMEAELEDIESQIENFIAQIGHSSSATVARPL